MDNGVKVDVEDIDGYILAIGDCKTEADFLQLFNHLNTTSERMYHHGYLHGRFDTNFGEFFEKMTKRYSKEWNLGVSDGKGDKDADD